MAVTHPSARLHLLPAAAALALGGTDPSPHMTGGWRVAWLL